MRPGWNPTRRNRNIGTAKSGHGQDNRLVIPNIRRDLTPYWSRLARYTTILRRVNGNDIAVLVEPTRRHSVHACTVDDVFHMLRHVPVADLEGIGLVILRQPKRKEEVLAPCWGRLAYLVEIGAHKSAAIILEAADLGRPFQWSKSLRPDDAEELDRLRTDGHKIKTTTRGYTIELTLEAVRATQLYRTLWHEIGHWVHYLEVVERPTMQQDHLWSGLRDRYDQIPHAEKERFAHRYADRQREALLLEKAIPFPRMFDEEIMVADGLRSSDFSR